MAKTTMVLYRLIDLLHLIESGELAVPCFQRGYVWSKEAAKQLFISVNRGYPIGVIIAAEHAGEQLDAFSSGIQASVTPGGQMHGGLRRLWLVDGSQRIATLHEGLLGPHESFPLLYALRRHEFLFSEQGVTDVTLVKTSSLFNVKDLMWLQGLLANLPDGESVLAELNGIRDRFYSYLVPVMILREFELPEIIEVFAAANTSGVALTKKELAQAMRHTSRKD